MTRPLRPGVFLDRDGTLIEEADYLADPDGVSLVPGAEEALRALRAAGYALVVVTNQSGIARGLYSLADYEAVAARLDRVLEDAGVPVDGTRFCPHHPERTGPCRCRKPGTGMHRDAAAELGIDLRRSWCVGDKVADVLPADDLGGRGAVLVRTGYGAAVREPPAGVLVAADLREAARMILTADGTGEAGP